MNLRDHAKERLGGLMLLQGKDHEKADAFVNGDIGAVAKLKDVQTGDLLADSEREIEAPKLDFPEPVMSFAVTPKTKGDEDKVAQALRRLHEEDPTLQLRRDPQTGEQLLSGMSQVHVEVAVGRMKSRFGVEVELHQPRVPYVETIKGEARAQGRYKKQTGGRGQFGDCHIVIEPIEGHVGYEFVDQIVGGVIPQGFRPAVDKGVQETMAHGVLAGAPIQGVRVRLVDGSYHTVDSSEMAFKVAGSMAFKTAYERAQPTLLEPIMALDVTVPDEAVGAVNGDLNSRRGRLHGMEPAGGMTTIKAEVPMAEVLTYSQSLTSMTGGRGDYHMEFLRYEEVPAHIAQKLIDAREERPGGRSGVARVAGISSLGCGRNSYPRGRESHPDQCDKTCAVCERTLLMGERTVRFSPNGGDAVRRRLPSLPGDRARLGLGEGRLADQPDDPGRPPEEPLLALLAARREGGGGGACRERADPAAALGDRACDRRGRRPLQRLAVPPHGRRDREEPRGAARLDHAALGGERRDRDHGRLGHLLVPVPRHPGPRCAGAAGRTGPRSGRARRGVHGLERAHGRGRPDRPGHREGLIQPERPL